MPSLNNKPTGARPTDLLKWTLVALFILLCVASYAPALQGPLFFDDIPNLLDNKLLRVDASAFDNWRAAIVSNDSGVLHRPIAMATFTLNHAIAGSFSPLVFKGTNLVIHLLIGVLVFHFCRALLRAPALAASGLAREPLVPLAAAALWLLHPLQVSTVLYVVQRMAQLSTLFTVLGLVVFCRYRLRWAAEGASTGEVLAAGLWLLLISLVAVLSKENGALLPWLVVVIEVVLFRGVWNGRPNGALVRLGWCALLLPVLLVGMVFLFSPESITGRYGGREFTLEERLLTQSRLLWQYLGWILLPNITQMGFFHDDIPLSRGLLSPWTTLLSLCAWLAVTMFALRLRERYPLLLFTLLFYLVGHAMESTVLSLEMVFEHRNYLPAIGVCLLAAVALCQLARRTRQLRYGVVLVIVFIPLVAQLALRVQAWKDEPSLASFNVVNHPDSARANFFYANTLFNRFARAQELGLDEEEKKSLAIHSRAVYMRVHELDPRSFPAMVMLHQLDTLHFPTLEEENDWLGQLEALARNKRLHASDRSALVALVEFSGSEIGVADIPRVQAILDRLLERYPRNVDLLVQQYRLLEKKPDTDRRELYRFLQTAVEGQQGGRELYAFMVMYHGGEDMAVTYDAVRAWMLRDKRRQELPLLLRIFKS